MTAGAIVQIVSIIFPSKINHLVCLFWIIVSLIDRMGNKTVDRNRCHLVHKNVIKHFSLHTQRKLSENHQCGSDHKGSNNDQMHSIC